MSYDIIIEQYEIIANINSPLAEDRSKIASCGIGDTLYIIGGKAYIRNWSDETDDKFSQTLYGPDFVRINPKIFKKVG